MTYSSTIAIRVQFVNKELNFFLEPDFFDPKVTCMGGKERQPIGKGNHVSVVRKSGLICVALYSSVTAKLCRLSVVRMLGIPFLNSGADVALFRRRGNR